MNKSNHKNLIQPLQPLIGWKAIAGYLQRSLTELAKKNKEWKEAGILFVKLQGRIPHRRKVVYSYPHLLDQWSQWETGRYTSQRHARRRAKQVNAPQPPQGIIEYEI